MGSVTLGPYELDAPAGKGGMGVVWRGVHRRLRAPVAVKLLLAAAVRNERSRAAFRHEVRAVAGLDHPNVVRVHDYGEIAEDQAGGELPAGTPYLVMEWAESSLATWRASSFSELRDVLLALLGALAHSHARDVVHRDLKPGNVLVVRERDGRRALKLADFGIARLGDDPRDVDFVGTPSYAAPEQVTGGEVGPWTDLYAIGCMAHRLAAGRAPFAGGEPGMILRAHVYERPPPVRAPFPIPAAFQVWVDRLLAKNAEHRPAFAADAAREIAAIVAGMERTRAAAAAPTDSDTPTVVRPRTDAPTELATMATPTIGPASGASGVGLGLYGLRALPFVGRDKEREALASALAAVSDGSPRAVVLIGPAGVGKTRLATWFCEQAHESGAARSLRVTNAEGNGLATAVARHLGCAGLRGPELVERLRTALPELGRFDLGAIAALVAPDGEPVQRAERFAAVLAVLTRLTRDRAAILLLDDVDSTAEDIELARFLLGRTGARLLVVLTAREEVLAERPHEASQLRRLEAGRRVQRIELGPLADGTSRQLVAALLGLGGDVAEQIHRRAAGNPLVAVQLVGECVQRGVLERGPSGFRLRAGSRMELPASLREVWRARVDRLLASFSEAEARGLEVAAVLGQQVDATEWEAACALAGVVAAPALVERMIVERLASASPKGAVRGWSFVHGMLRESVEERAGERLARWHEACAGALAGRKDHAALERRGLHLLSAGRPEQAVEPLAATLEALGDRAATRPDLTLATRRALELGGVAPEDRSWARLLQASMLQATSRAEYDAADAVAAELIDRGTRHGWIGIPSYVERMRSMLARKQGDLVSAERHAREAVAHAERETERDRILARFQLAAAVGDIGRYDELARIVEDLQVRTGEAGMPGLAGRAYDFLADIASQQGRYEEAHGHATRARAILAETGPRWQLAACTNRLADLERWLGRHEAADALYREARTHFAALGDSVVHVVDLNIALLSLSQGDVSAAIGILDGVLASFEVAEAWADLAVARLTRSWAAARQGEWEAYDRLWEQAMEFFRVQPWRHPDLAVVATGGARCAVEAGHPERARRALAYALDVYEGLGDARARAEVEALLANLREG